VMAMARMEIIRTVAVITIAFQLRDGKLESPAKFPSCPSFPQV
jgi:hypothetical protein